ncbi:MAG: porin family protein [Calditrichia bacterium]
MKKFTVFLLALLVLLSYSSFGYTQNSPVKFGVRGGLNLATVTEDVEGADKKMRMVFGAGGLLEYAFSPTAAIQVNAMYSMKGAKYEATEGEGKMNLKFAYLSIPILGKVAFGEGSAKPYVCAGPEIGILLSSKAEFTNGESEEEDIKDESESMEFALNFGAGVQFPMGNMTGFVDARYGLGLSKVNKEGDEDVKNNVIFINFGLLFGGQ